LLEAILYKEREFNTEVAESTERTEKKGIGPKNKEKAEAGNAHQRVNARFFAGV